MNQKQRPLFTNNVAKRITAHVGVIEKVQDYEPVLTPAELEELADISEKLHQLRDRAVARMVSANTGAFRLSELQQYLYVSSTELERMSAAGQHLLWLDESRARRQQKAPAG